MTQFNFFPTNSIKVALNLLVFLMIVIELQAQLHSNVEMPVSINQTGLAPDASSILDLDATDKGVLIPRLTTAQKNAITGPATGLLIFDRTLNNFCFYDGISWVEIPQSTGGPITVIEDADGDTRVDVEESADDDEVHVYLNNTKHITFKENSDGTANTSYPSSSQNLFIGNLAGASNELANGADKNTFIGYFSGKLNKTGKNNTFVGRNSGAIFQSGQANCFLGMNAGADLPTGNANIFIGVSAGAHLNQYCHNNTVIGTNAAANVRYTTSNVMVGAYAGRSGGEDGYNVFLGSNSGEVSDSTSGNIFIGYSSGKFEQNNDRLIIENSSSGMPLIYGEFANDKVGINWDSSMALPNELTVNGDASKTTPGDWLANSDARLKKNITALDSKEMLQKLVALEGVHYEWNDDKTGYKRPTGIQYGFTAQNMKEVWPNLVSEDSKGFLQTSYGSLDHMYVESIKELAAENAKLKNQLATHQADMENFGTILKSLQAELASLKSDPKFQD